MYPLRINLLSPKKKSRLTKTMYIQFFKSLCEVLLFFVTLVAITLLGSQRVLQTYFSELTENIISVRSTYSNEIRDIMHINKLLTRTEQIQKKYVTWTPLVATFASSTTDGITLDNIIFDNNERKITISGHADTRDQFLHYQETLESTPIIQAVHSPLSGLTQQTNISFTITADL